MCLPKDFKFSENIECGNGGISAIYFMKSSDLKLVNGVLVKKRKYGKFKREIVKLVKP